MMAIIERLHALSQRKGVWTLADQGVVSLGNFLTNIVLARNLTEKDYGSYLLIYGALIFLNGFHTYLITYHLSVKGSVADPSGLRCLTTDSVIITTLLAPFLSLGAFAASFFVGKVEVTFAVITALFFWQMQETLRRGLMSHLRYSEVVWGDALSYLGQAGLAWFLAQKGLLSAGSAFLVIALTSALACVIQTFQLRPGRINLKSIWNSARIGWNLGKWYLLGNVVSIANIHATPWVLAAYHGSKETAAVQAVINVVGISNPIIFSTSNIIVPAVAKANVENGMKGVRQVAFNYGLKFGLLLLPFYGMLFFFPRKMLELIYGQSSSYLDLENVLRIFVLAYVLLYLSQIPTSILGGLEKSKSAFAGNIASSVPALLIGIPLMIQVGAMGAGLSNIFSNMARIIINIFQLRRL